MIISPAKSKRVQRQRISVTKSIPAPIGGWNARDSLADMRQTDAVVLENLFPNGSDVELRQGKLTHATGLPDVVESLFPYQSSTTSKLFAASGAGIYDVTVAGAVGAAAVSGLTNVRFQWAQISIAGSGSYLYCVNGADSPRLYNGTTWTAITGVSVPAITGVTASTLVNVHLFKRRLWFVEVNAMRVWYLPVDSIGGAATAFDLGPLFDLGGSLLAMGSWTLDAGHGLDDHAVFITTEGEIAVYRGTDPASATTWALVGVYQIGRPIGYRCLYKYLGDILVICEDGLYPLSKALLSSRVSNRVALTDKIEPALVEATSLYKQNFGWQALAWAKKSMLILNIPTDEDVSYQAVMNTITGAWCKFSGLSCLCLEQVDDTVYLGSDTTVDILYGSSTDNGAQIVGNALQAFTNFGQPEVQKHFRMARPIILTNGNPGLVTVTNTDFDTNATTPSISAAGGVSATMAWGSMIWGSMIWGAQLSILQDWIGVDAVGNYGAMRQSFSSAGETVQWMATGHLYEIGDVL